MLTFRPATLFLLNAILNDTVTITGFLLAMMIAIEYFHVTVRHVDRWQRFRTGWRQYVVAALLGALPGCLGPWAVVSLYSHGLMSLGALVAAMAATSGDEAYVMLALFPGDALLLFAGLLVVGILLGWITDMVLSRTRFAGEVHCEELTIHPKESRVLWTVGDVLQRSFTGLRSAITLAFLALCGLIASGVAGPEEWGWMRVALLAAMGFALFVIVTVPNHFLEEHLWHHVLRRHAPRIIAWTLAALIAADLLVGFLDLGSLGPGGMWTMLVAACLIGIIPESGPHLVFATLYAKGALPMSVLLASSLVQDGHGMLPLLAESRRAFLLTKAINLIAGFLLGAIALGLGF